MTDAPSKAVELADKPQATILKPVDDARTGNERFRRAVKRLVSNPDDARGQIALGLFLYEAIDRDKKSTSESICEALELVAPATLSIVYLAAANRLLDEHFDTLARKKVDAEISKDRLYVLLSQQSDLRTENLTSQIEAGYSNITAEVRALARTHNFPRQIATSAFATVLVVACAITIAFGPDIVSVLKRLFTAS